MNKCQCPEKAIRNPISDLIGYLPEEEIAREHEPNECKGTYQLILSIRDGEKLWLCSACILFGDIPIKGGDSKMNWKMFVGWGLLISVVIGFVGVVFDTGNNTDFASSLYALAGSGFYVFGIWAVYFLFKGGDKNE